MTPQRRGIFVTLLVLGLTLCVGVAVVLAVTMTAKPDQGPRDNGGGTQTQITLSGDLLDPGTTSWQAPHAYWDTPDPNNPVAAYEIPLPRGAIVNPDGSFSFNITVPLTDGSSLIVRPGAHVITVCATHGGLSTAGVRVCTSTNFNVLEGTVDLSRSAGRPGEGINVHGERFVPGALNPQVRVTLGGLLVQEGPPGSSTFDEPFNVPSLTPGNYKLITCNLDNGRVPTCHPQDTVTKDFTILAPKLKLNPTSGFANNAFVMSGSGFYSKRALHLFFGPVGTAWNGPGVVEIKPGVSKNTDGSGDFGPYDYAPNDPPGDYWVIACTFDPVAALGACDRNDTVQEVYTILAPTPSPSPTPTTKPTKTPTPSSTPSAKPTKTPSPTPTKSPTPSPTPTAKPTASPTPTATAAPTVILTAAPSASASVSPTPSATPTPIAEPTAAPASAFPTTSPTSTPETTPEKTPDETAEPTIGPTAPPPPPTPNANITWPDHLQSPGQVAGGGFDLSTVGTMGLLALLIAFLVPFPGTLFNKTVEANYTEIMGWMAGLNRRWTSLLSVFAIGPLGGVRRFLGRLVTGRLGVLVFLSMSALVYSFLSPTFGFDTNSLALFLGLMVGLAFITAAFDLPLRIYHGRTSKAHDRGVLRALWWTLLVAVICVIVSRLSNFQPGYLYGLVVSIVFVTEISTRDEGLGTWLASTWLIILSFVAWVLLAFVRQSAGFDPWLSLFLQTVLVTFVVAGIETLAVGLLPMRFLPGHPLFRWRRGMWFVVFALSVMGYLLILVDPANGYLSDDSRTPMLVGAIFLVTFGIVSLGTWAYFRFRPKGARLDRPGEAPSA